MLSSLSSSHFLLPTLIIYFSHSLRMHYLFICTLLSTLLLLFAAPFGFMERNFRFQRAVKELATKRQLVLTSCILHSFDLS